MRSFPKLSGVVILILTLGVLLIGAWRAQEIITLWAEGDAGNKILTVFLLIVVTVLIGTSFRAAIRLLNQPGPGKSSKSGTLDEGELDSHKRMNK